MKTITYLVVINVWVYCCSAASAPRDIHISNFVHQKNKSRPTIALVGCNSLGCTIAYTFLLKKMAINLIFSDGNVQQSSTSTAPFNENPQKERCSIKHGNLKDAGQADIIILTACSQSKENQSIKELIKSNKTIISQCIEQMKPLNNKTIIIVATKPVDIMSYFVQQATGLAPHQVFGMGTYLETKRLESRIAQLINVNPQSVNAFVIGSEGEQQVTAWSSATCAGMSLHHFCPMIETLHKNIEQQNTYAKLNNTDLQYFDLSIGILEIVKSILFDNKKLMTVSCYNPEYKIYFSQPAVIGSTGIERIVAPQLDMQEQEKLDLCIKIITQLTSR